MATLTTPAALLVLPDPAMAWAVSPPVQLADASSATGAPVEPLTVNGYLLTAQDRLVVLTAAGEIQATQHRDVTVSLPFRYASGFDGALKLRVGAIPLYDRNGARADLVVV